MSSAWLAPINHVCEQYDLASAVLFILLVIPAFPIIGLYTELILNSAGHANKVGSSSIEILLQAMESLPPGQMPMILTSVREALQKASLSHQSYAGILLNKLACAITASIKVPPISRLMHQF